MIGYVFCCRYAQAANLKVPSLRKKPSLNLTPGDGSSWEERGNLTLLEQNLTEKNLTWSHQDVSEYLSIFFPDFSV